MSVIPAIAECLKGSYPSDSAFIGSAGRVAAVAEVVAAVAGAVYWSRRPEPTGHSAIALRVLSQSPEYALDSEIGAVQPIIQVDVFTKGRPPIVCLNLADACRRALSGYRGTLWHPDETEVMIHSAVILREPTEPARLPTDAGVYWSFAAGFDCEVTYTRTVIAS